MVLNSYRKQLMAFKTKVKIAEHWTYFNTGAALTSQFKMFVYAYMGADILATADYTNSFIIVSVYIIGCYIVGRVFYKTDMAKAMAEVGNKNNLLSKEMREKFKLKSSKP